MHSKKNKALYIIFIFFCLLYANHTLFICLELLWDDVNLPYDSKLLHIYIFDQKRGFRVLGASACGVFSLIVGLPLWFLFLIEMLKLCGLFGNKKRNIESQLQEIILSTSDKSPEKLLAPSMVELREEKQEMLIDDEGEDEKGLLLNTDEENLNNGTINDEDQEKIKESIANEEEQKQEEENKEEGEE